jgi:hypothetical protein
MALYISRGIRHNAYLASKPFTSSIMSLIISEGQNQAQVKTDIKELIDKDWKLDQEQIQLEKTYYFKTYTKVTVSRALRTLVALGS